MTEDPTTGNDPADKNARFPADDARSAKLPDTETYGPTPLPDGVDMPKSIGRYHIKRVIASGGMGTVYEAVQENPRRAVAVKVMRQGIVSRSALRRFEFEAQLLARLRHPGIAQIYEAGTHRDADGETPASNPRRP